MGLAEIWAWIGPGIGLIYNKLLFRLGPVSALMESIAYKAFIFFENIVKRLTTASINNLSGSKTKN